MEILKMLNVFFEGFPPKNGLILFLFFYKVFLMTKVTIKYDEWGNYTNATSSYIGKDDFKGIQVILFT